MRKITTLGLLGLAVAWAMPGMALAARPTVIEFPGIVYDDPWLCGGDPVVHVAFEGTFRLTLFSGPEGGLVRDAITPGGKLVVTLGDEGSGRSLSSVSPAVFRSTYAADGSITSVTANGLNAAITIPGEGVILLDTGTITWTGFVGGPVVVSAGPHAQFGGEGADAFCEYLRG